MFAVVLSCPLLSSPRETRNGSVILRSAGTALHETEKRFRGVKGHRDMPGMMTPLEALCRAAQENAMEVSPGITWIKIRPPSINGHQDNPSLMGECRSDRMTP
jgi:hypothetical protein